MKKRFIIIIVAVLVCGSMFTVYQHRDTSRSALSSVRFPEEQLIIDAGHGGEDGGAVSVSGVTESQINLSIALKLDAICGLYGISPVVLRTEDTSLHDADAKTARERKKTDLINRVAQIQEYPNATLISIHQNNFTSASAHGAQVFYSNPELSLPLALTTQDTLRATLDPDNDRVAMKIGETIYLMNHITCRAILVECGFLSNQEEDALLQTEEYQTKIATALLSSWLEYQRDATEQELDG
ncbi:MAG: N-acetylmuramoyl-L-alanine amidase [Oscillospiraceae bacterium]|nr:N-acetylmuramoyl-L-alanine amidase [Oscillospiraceae bacterium]